MFVDELDFGPEFGGPLVGDPFCDPVVCEHAVPAATHTASVTATAFTHTLRFIGTISTMLIVSNPLANRRPAPCLNLLFFLTDAIPTPRYAKTSPQNPQLGLSKP